MNNIARPHILCFMANPTIRNGGTKRYLLHASKFTAWAKVTMLINRQLSLPPSSVRYLPICNRATRPVYGWMIYFWRVVRNINHADIGTVDYILIYGSNNILAAARLKRKTKASLIFDPRQNDIECLRMQYRGTRHTTSHQRLAKRWFLWLQMHVRVIIQYFLYIIIAHYADLMLFQTDYELETHRKQMLVMPRRMAVLPNSFDDGHAQTNHQPLNSTPNGNQPTAPKPLQVLYCGALVVRKGIWEIIDAILQLWSQRVAISLTILGDGPEHILIDRYLRIGGLTVKNTNIPHDTHMQYFNPNQSDCSISLCGWITTPKPYFYASDVVAVPSYVEAFPDVILEALELKIPVIASDIPNIRYMLQHDALLFAARSATALATKLQQLIEHPAILELYHSLCRSRSGIFSFDYASRFQQTIYTHIPVEISHQ